MRKIVFVLLLMILSAFLSCNFVGQVHAAEVYGAELVDTPVILQPYNYPGAIFVESVNTTFFTYAKKIGGIGYVYAKQYNHTTAAWSSPFLIGNWNNDDAHKCPAIGYLWDGRLIIFHGNHGQNEGHIKYRVSINPWDTTAWASQQTHAGWYDYTQPVSYSDQLQLFVRFAPGYSYSPEWRRFTFNSTGFWLDETMLVDDGGGGATAWGFYAMFRKGTDDNIYMAASLWNHTKTSGWRADLYYMYSDDRGYTWKEADESSVTIPVTNYVNINIENTTSFHGAAYAMRDKDNNPFIMSLRGNPPGAAAVDRWNALYASYWDGSSWTGGYVKNQYGETLNTTGTWADSSGYACYPLRDQDFNTTVFWWNGAPIATPAEMGKLSRYVQSDTDFVFVNVLETEIGETYAIHYAVQDNADRYEMFCYVNAGVEYGYFVWNVASYFYTFKGVYDEDTGDLYPAATRAVNITAYFTTQEPETFELNSTYWYGLTEQPLYFSFNTSSNRQYWLTEGENIATIYVYDTTLSAYTIEFIDLAGALEDYAFIEIKRYVGDTLMTVEKRKVDAEDKIAASLKQGEKYIIEIKDGSTYTFGDVLFTSTSTLTLVLKGTEFPQEIILAYRYYRLWTYRHNNYSSISAIFEETESIQCDVVIDIQFENGTSISGTYPYTYNDVTSFNHTWASAQFNTSYIVQSVITHPTFGSLPYNTPLARGFINPTVWNFPLGNIPNLPTAYIIPSFLIFGAFLLFSKINAYLAGFIGVGIAILLTWWNWIPIPATALITALILSILLAMATKKREPVI